MVVDIRYVEKLRQNRIEVSQELEDILIDRLGKEPEPYTFSEQDLYEQARKIIERYRVPKGRLELLYAIDKLEDRLEIIHSQIQLELGSNEEDF